MIIIAIDPGDKLSALVMLDCTTGLPTAKCKIPNEEVLERIANAPRLDVEIVVVEKIQARGMPVGQDTMDTCWWGARFYQRAIDAGMRGEWLYRNRVKVHLCGVANAKDSNIRRALIDLYGPSEREAKGTKKAPGPLYGFADDTWAALAVARTYCDQFLPF